MTLTILLADGARVPLQSTEWSETSVAGLALVTRVAGWTVTHIASGRALFHARNAEHAAYAVPYFGALAIDWLAPDPLASLSSAGRADLEHVVALLRERQLPAVERRAAA